MKITAFNPDFSYNLGAGAPFAQAGGDLGGNFPGPTVTGLEGIPFTGTPAVTDLIQFNGTNWVFVAPGSISGVTSVGLTMPAEFTVAGSPVTSSGTLAVTKANENANLVYAGPASGAAAAPTFRALVAADIPAGVGAVHEVVMVTGSAPPDPVLNSAGTDWVYSSS